MTGVEAVFLVAGLAIVTGVPFMLGMLMGWCVVWLGDFQRPANVMTHGRDPSVPLGSRVVLVSPRHHPGRPA